MGAKTTSTVVTGADTVSHAQRGRHNEPARVFSPRDLFAAARSAVTDEATEEQSYEPAIEISIGRPVSNDVYEQLKKAAETAPPGPSRERDEDGRL